MFRDEATFDVDELKEIFGHVVNSPTGKRSRVLHSYIDVKDTSSFFFMDKSAVDRAAEEAQWGADDV